MFNNHLKYTYLSAITLSVVLHAALIKTFFYQSKPTPPNYKLPGQSESIQAILYEMTTAKLNPQPKKRQTKPLVQKVKIAPSPNKKSYSIKKSETLNIAPKIKKPRVKQKVKTEMKAIDGKTINKLVVILYQQIQTHLQKPMIYKSGKVIVRFDLFPSGQISHLSISQSSGNRLLDSAALKTLLATAPFKHLPPEFRQKQTFALPVIYH